MTEREMAASLKRCAGHVAALQADFREDRRELDRLIELLGQVVAEEAERICREASD